MKKKLAIFSFLVAIAICMPMAAEPGPEPELENLADGPEPPPTDVPINTYITILTVAGVCYAAIRINNKTKKVK